MRLREDFSRVIGSATAAPYCRFHGFAVHSRRSAREKGCMTSLTRPALALVALAVIAAPAAAATPAPPPPAPSATPAPAGWPQSRSDLPADPSIRFGVLPNGLRYAIMRNATPPGQVSMRLRFEVGSLMERDDQQGLAHFLEHMAFNGSTNVPTRGAMVQDLERLGLAFGADTNAGTEFDATTYKFNLPKSDDQTVDTSLMLLREIASNLTLDQKAMDEERGVILSEERLRDSPSYRIFKDSFGFALLDQRPPQRFPIGLVPVIQTAKRDLLADLYQHYYRPERATLVIVGDIDPDKIEAKIKARFGDWAGQGTPGANPDLGQVRPRSLEVKTSVEPGAASEIELAWVSPPDLDADTIAKRKRLMVEQLGLAVLNRRLSTLVRATDPPFISAGAISETVLRAERLTAVQVLMQPDHWRQALAAAETEVRRAVQYGVRPDELAREISEDEVSLRTAAAGAATRRTPDLADEIAASRSDDQVEISPAESLALFDEVTKGLTSDQVSAALRDLFKGGGPLVFTASPTPLDGGAEAVRTAFQAAATAPVAAPTAQAQVDWPYQSFGAPGKIADRKDIADLDTVFVRFENGVQLTIKSTKFRQDQVLVRVRVGSGRDGQDPTVQQPTWAQSALIEGGLGKITANDAERALASQIYGANVGTDSNAYLLGGETRGADLETQLQVLAAYVTDPAWRPEAFTRLRNYGPQLETQLASTDSNVMSRDLEGMVHDGDRRWTFPTGDQIAAETIDQLKAEIGPGLASGPLEVVIVGDITVDKAIEAVADTFGALPKRPDPAPPGPPAHDTRFPAPTATPVVDTHNGRADQGIAFIAWPTTGFFADVNGSRANALLSRVLQLRLIDVFRQNQGVTYSPAAGEDASQYFPHWGYVSAQIEAPPDKLDGFFTDVAKIAADLRTTPIGADELERARKPTLEQLDKAKATNLYWLDRLSGAQSDPRLLDAIRSSEAGLERLTAADLQHAAQTWLRDDTAWKLEIKPKPAAP
jgi:zinc protease